MRSFTACSSLKWFWNCFQFQLLQKLRASEIYKQTHELYFDETRCVIQAILLRFRKNASKQPQRLNCYLIAGLCLVMYE